MHKTTVISVLALVSLALAMPVNATHEGCNGVVTPIEAGSETIYLDDRSTAAGEINHWFYLESNTVEGLQSGGDNAALEDNLLFTFTDACAHSNPDTLIL